jgi:hypothetical protein
MKRVDSLVKKVELFEKLAKHGDRGSFLRSLAQESPLMGRAHAKSLVDQIKAIMNKANIRDESLIDAMGNVSLFGKTDDNSLSQAASAARKLMTMISPLAYEGAAKDQNALKDIAAKLDSMTIDNGHHENVGENAGHKAVESLTTHTPIDTNVQRAIGKITVTEGVGLPIEVDGDLGPETRAAIKRFKKYIMKNEAATDKEAFQKALELIKDPKYNV